MLLAYLTVLWRGRRRTGRIKRTGRGRRGRRERGRLRRDRRGADLPKLPIISVS